MESERLSPRVTWRDLMEAAAWGVSTGRALCRAITTVVAVGASILSALSRPPGWVTSIAVVLAGVALLYALALQRVLARLAPLARRALGHEALMRLRATLADCEARISKALQAWRKDDNAGIDHAQQHWEELSEAVVRAKHALEGTTYAPLVRYQEFPDVPNLARFRDFAVPFSRTLAEIVQGIPVDSPLTVPTQSGSREAL